MLPDCRELNEILGDGGTVEEPIDADGQRRYIARASFATRSAKAEWPVEGPLTSVMPLQLFDGMRRSFYARQNLLRELSPIRQAMPGYEDKQKDRVYAD